MEPSLASLVCILFCLFCFFCDLRCKDAAETQAVAAAFADTEDAMRVDGDSSAGSSDEVSCQLPDMHDTPLLEMPYESILFHFPRRLEPYDATPHIGQMICVIYSYYSS